MNSKGRRGRYQDPEPCCDTPSGGPWWCSLCEGLLCDTCWEKQFAHTPKARNWGNHQKAELALAEVIVSILDPETDPDEQNRLFDENNKTKWFGVFNELGSLTFRDFGQYGRLVVGMGGRDDMPLQYPSLSSFVGETGSGKSTLISALMKIKATGALSHTPTPVMGTATGTRPTSGEVHLYADPSTYNERRPYFYADCEGFTGGNDPPLTSMGEISAQPAMAWARKRDIPWPTEQQRSRQWIVENLYPRVLFTFSDTICFVTRNLRVIEDVFCRLIMWAEKVFDQSINQPMLPHAIIVVNAVDVKDLKDADDLWDVDGLTSKQLKAHKDCFRDNHALSQLKDNWKRLGKNIVTIKDFLELYYGDVKIICIPHGRLPPALIKKQYSRLYEELKYSSDEAMTLRTRSGLLMTSDDLGYYLESAFDHFSQIGNKPFDFLATAVRRRPIAQTFKDHFLKVAVLLQTLYPLWSGQEIFERMSRLVASCILLDSIRQNYPQIGLFKKYEPGCAEAQNEFYRSYWPCEYEDTRGRKCVNVWTGHSKGHQLDSGKVFHTGPYISAFQDLGRKMAFLDAVQKEFTTLIQEFHTATHADGDGTAHESDAASFHREQSLVPFVNDYIRDTRSLESHKTCFGCLFKTPVHALHCGHVLCRHCIMNFAEKRLANEIEITVCPLCPRSSSPWVVPWKLQLMPPYSGLRVLSLDGGGVRGIVQLTILEILEDRIGLDIPIQQFFDLIVGTSAGGMVALALGHNLLSIKECKKTFRSLCKRAFTKHLLAGLPGVKGIVRSNHHGLYKTKELEKALKEVFAEKPIFGGEEGFGNPSQRKVGVTSTSSSGYPYLHANYNRAQSEDTPYVFLRGETHKEELEIWEAARASPAAPTYFRSFYDKKTGYTFTDGGLRYNNPVQVADLERKLLWPHLRYQPPALFLSIGTGFDSTSKSENKEGQRIQRGPWGYIQHLVKIAWDQLQTSLDCEHAWKNFIRPLDLREEDDERKYCRLNLDYRENLPKLDDVEKMDFLEENTRAYFLQQKVIDGVADTLVASLFYFKLENTKRAINSTTRWVCEGTILCQLPQGSPALKKLCRKLWRIKNNSIAMFSVKERPVSDRDIPYPNDEFLKRIYDGRPFSLDVGLSVWEGEESRIYLQLTNGRRGLIGGFPRALVQSQYPQAEEDKRRTL